MPQLTKQDFQHICVSRLTQHILFLKKEQLISNHVHKTCWLKPKMWKSLLKTWHQYKNVDAIRHKKQYFLSEGGTSICQQCTLFCLHYYESKYELCTQENSTERFCILSCCYCIADIIYIVFWKFTIQCHLNAWPSWC